MQLPKRILLATLASLAACGGTSDSPTTAAAPPAAPPADALAAEASQVDQGAAVFGEYCASCHGADGSGTEGAPALVGPDALPLEAPEGRKRDVPFHTAGDVYRWVSKAMPANDPGSLSAEQYAAVLAFALQANGVDMSNIQLTEEEADKIMLHE